MTKEQEERRDAIKRWYLDKDIPMTTFLRDVNLCREMNNYSSMGEVIDHLYQEHVELGNIKVDSQEK